MYHKLPLIFCLLALTWTTPSFAKATKQSKVLKTTASKKTPPCPSGTFGCTNHNSKAPFSQGAKIFEQVKKLLLKHYPNHNLDENQLYKAAVKGMLHYIDPSQKNWNKLISPEEFKEMNSMFKGEIAGIGIVMKFQEKSGIVNVIQVLDKSPAQRAGIKGGDRILQVEGKSFRGKKMLHVVYAIRGALNSKVKLTILRGHQIKQIVVTRGRVKWSPVVQTILPKKIGYIRIVSFNYRTRDLVKQALTEFGQKGLKGLILDLRHNSGGLLQSALNTADLLIEKKKIIAMFKTRTHPTKIFYAKVDMMLKGLPLHVLINNNTTSGAELVAAALKETRGARLLGAKTFGKWNAQRISSLANTYAVKFTVGRFYSPKGNRYQGTGLSPDIPITSPKRLDLSASSLRNIKAHLKRDTALRIAHLLLTSS